MKRTHLIEPLLTQFGLLADELGDSTSIDELDGLSFRKPDRYPSLLTP